MECKVGDKIPNFKRFDYSNKEALEELKNLENYVLEEDVAQQSSEPKRYRRLFTNQEGVIVKIEEVEPERKL